MGDDLQVRMARLLSAQLRLFLAGCAAAYLSFVAWMLRKDSHPDGWFYTCLIGCLLTAAIRIPRKIRHGYIPTVVGIWTGLFWGRLTSGVVSMSPRSAFLTRFGWLESDPFCAFPPFHIVTVSATSASLFLCCHMSMTRRSYFARRGKEPVSFRATLVYLNTFFVSIFASTILGMTFQNKPPNYLFAWSVVGTFVGLLVWQIRRHPVDKKTTVPSGR